MTLPVIKSVLIAFVMLGTMSTQASDNIDIVLNSVSNLSPQMRDGQLIGHGEISTYQPHSGYQVWLNAEKKGDAPNRYVLSGRNNGQHKLYVIIGQDGWVPDINGGLGIIKHTKEGQAQFDIVANGGQTVSIDDYIITVQGRYLEL